jgi:hypothetical protein
LQDDLGLGVPALIAQRPAEGLEAVGDQRMTRAEELLAPRQRLAGELLGLSIPAREVVEPRQVVERAGEVGMRFAEPLALKLEELLGAGDRALVVAFCRQHQRQVVGRQRGGEVVLTQLAAVGLEGRALERLGFLVPAALEKQQGEIALGGRHLQRIGLCQPGEEPQ